MSASNEAFAPRVSSIHLVDEAWPTGGGHPAHGLFPALIDQIECGLIVCDDSGAVQWVNRAAERELADHAVLRCEGHHLSSAHNPAALDKALKLAASRGVRGLVRIGDPQGDSLMVAVQPLSWGGGVTGGTGVLVVLGRRRPCSDLGLQLLGTVYGLTLAERRVLAGLVRNATAREIAIENCVSLNTVRTQILAIRGKVGARSIDELLLRVSEVPPVASVLRQGGTSTPMRLAA